MKKIKLRIWDKEKNTFYTESEHYRAGELEEYYSGEISILLYLFTEIRDSDRYVIQQWIGLQDKNGLDIYEGDVIIDWKEGRVLTIKKNDSPVQFLGESFYLDSTMTDPDIFSFALHNEPNRYEVIGTIFGLKEKPCKPDHNGECLICDCWLHECHLHEHLRIQNETTDPTRQNS